jgi:hypothetical protein
MTYSSASQLGPEFENFLFAPIGADRNGMLLSVLSALARLDIDPWQEAAQLASLPEETATRRLSSLIAALPDGPSTHPDPETNAARLIALLPLRSGSKIAPRMGVPGAVAPTHPQAITYVYVIFMVIALSAQWIAAGRQPPAQVGNVQATSSTVSPVVQPPISK